MKKVNLKLLEYALDSLKKGISVIPVAKTKIPLIPWREFQTRYATESEVRDWFNKFDDPQIGFVTGKISNLIIVDSEKGADPSFLPQETTIVESGNKGYHYYYLYQEGISNKARIKELIDIRGEGGYCVSPNSCSEKGPYTLLQDLPLLPFPKELFPPKVDIFQYPSSSSTFERKPIAEYSGFGTGSRNQEMAKYIGSVLVQIHPADWDTEGWNLIVSANNKNTPPLSSYELSNTFNSIKRTERAKNPLGHARGHIEPSSGISEPDTPIIFGEDDEVMHIAEVADLQKINSSDVFPLEMPCFDELINGGVNLGDVITIAGQTGHGKCLGKGTKVLMYSGKIKKVEDIKVGDKLMGDDSTPRNVLSLARGKEMMYDITPTRGEGYKVNESHILSLKKRNRWSHGKKTLESKVINISVKDYLSIPAKKAHFGYKVPINWKETKIPINPYFLGLWLGDGHTSTVTITTADSEILDFLSEYSKEIGLSFKIREQKGNKSVLASITRGNKEGGSYVFSLQKKLRDLGVLNNKHIPLLYKANSREVRLKLLAGLIDSDGYINKPSSLNYVSKLDVLANDVVFLARSLGFFATVKKITKTIKKIGFSGVYNLVSISGNLNEIPTKLLRKKCPMRKQIKDVLVSQIKVTPIGVDNYYGFEIDGNKLFLLGDFTVTHNTSLIQDWTISLIRGEKKLKALWFTYEVLPIHLWKKFQEMGLTREDCVFAPSKHSTGDVAWVEQKIKEGKEKFGIKAVFIDHLGFLLPKTNGVLGKAMSANYASFLTQIMRDLKTLALQEEVVIFLPVHMKKVDSRNRMSDSDDIKDSSGIGQESDLVFLIEREKNKEKDAKTYFTDMTKITLAKNRKTGSTLVANFSMIGGRFAYDDSNNEEKKSLSNYAQLEAPNAYDQDDDEDVEAEPTQQVMIGE